MGIRPVPDEPPLGVLRDLRPAPCILQWPAFRYCMSIHRVICKQAGAN